MNANDDRNGNHERERALERLLSRELRAEAPRRDGDCLDDETVASWFDGVLSRDERARAEAHLAGCSRCQAVMASMVRTEPALSAARSAEKAAGRRWIGWLAPLAAAVAAVTIWAVVIRREPAPLSQVDTTARVESPATGTAEPPAAPPPAAALAPPVELLKKGSAPAESTTAPPAAASAAPERSDARRENAPAAAARSQSAAAEQQVDALADRNVAAAPAPASPPAAAPAAAPSAAFAVAQASGQADAIVVVSPDAQARWRLSGASISRSVDGGAQWSAVYQGTVRLTSAAAPSPSVCWVVGQAGLVLRSTDGVSFTRLAFPAAVDLVRVGATDAGVAAVTAADGRVFSTIDGGRTWTVR